MEIRYGLKEGNQIIINKLWLLFFKNKIHIFSYKTERIIIYSAYMEILLVKVSGKDVNE